MSTLEFDPLECTFGFEVKDKKVPLPKNYVELQQRIAENYMRNLSLSHVLPSSGPMGLSRSCSCNLPAGRRYNAARVHSPQNRGWCSAAGRMAEQARLRLGPAARVQA